MLTPKNILGLAGLAVLATSVPAQAQERRRDVVDEIIRGVEEAADAAVRVDDAVRGASRRVRWRGVERYAVDACELQAERYGRVHIDDVRRYKRNSWRVYGVADPAGGYDRRADSRYDRRYEDRRYEDRRYDRRYNYDRRYEPRRFTCTVRTDGRVTKFKTDRIRRSRYG
jgi:hypothetical protein